GQVMGTPQYLSPEQARGNTATPASDVYSLGVVAFECLAGHRPFQADSPVATALAHLHEPVPDLPASVPRNLAAVVRRALSKEPADRYPDATAFAAALRNPATEVVAAVPPLPPVSERTQVLTGVPPAAAPIPAPDPTAAGPVVGEDRAGRRRAWLIALLVLVLVAVAVAAVVFATRGNDTPTNTPTPSTSSAGTVTIDEASFVGRPVDEVRRELTGAGLKVSTEPQTNPGGETAGLVTAVNPTGTLNVGDAVKVQYWGQAPSATPSATPTQTPSATPSETPSATPSATPSDTPSPSTTPSVTSSPSVTASLPASSAPASADASGSASPQAKSTGKAPRR
ncbi:MAG: pknA, partial [Nocardioides sp.]|nr:pknA [Nocardioides sp.]